MTKSEQIERYGLEWYEAYLVRHKEQYHNDPEYREACKARSKARSQNNPEYLRKYCRKYTKVNLNSAGKTKSNIRAQSNQILFRQRKHSRLKGYEIHHAFGYDDPSKFVYIPRELHVKIHQYLRDNGIAADSCHFDSIKHLINEYTGYTYISV